MQDRSDYLIVARVIVGQVKPVVRVKRSGNTAYIRSRYGLPHGTLNGICLPPVLRFNAAYAPEAVRRFGEAVGAPEALAGRVEELAALAGSTRLRELGVPEADLPEVAADAAQRGGNLANPKPATPQEIELLLREVF